MRIIPVQYGRYWCNRRSSHSFLHRKNIFERKWLYQICSTMDNRLNISNRFHYDQYHIDWVDTYIDCSCGPNLQSNTYIWIRRIILLWPFCLLDWLSHFIRDFILKQLCLVSHLVGFKWASIWRSNILSNLSKWTVKILNYENWIRVDISRSCDCNQHGRRAHSTFYVCLCWASIIHSIQLLFPRDFDKHSLW